jgi:polysaccharide biosynthesis protein PslE
MGFDVSTYNKTSEHGNTSQSALMVAPAAPALSIAPPVAERSYVSLRQALVVLFFRRKLVLWVMGAVVFITAIAVALIPPRYHSEAKLLVRLGRESVVLDPSARIGEAAVPMEGRDKEINSEIELLKSRILTEQIVSSLGPNRILGRSPTATVADKDVASAVTLVEDKLTVEAIPDSNVLEIGYDSADPALSRDVIAKLIDAYLDARASVYRDQGDLKFFQDQLADAERDQLQLERKLQEVRDSSGVDNPEQQRTILLTRVDSLQHDIDAAGADKAATASSVAELDKQLSDLPQNQVIQEGSGAAMDSLDTLRSKLAELRLDEADLAARYMPDAPPLQIIHDKIAQAEKELTDASSSEAERTVGINHTYEELSIRRDNELANLASLTSRIQSLEAAKSKAQSGLALIEEIGVKTQALEQQAGLAAANVTKYAGAYEQARIDQAMGQHRISNISIAEPPVLPLQAKGPGRGLIALAGIFMALCLGIGSVFVAESVDHTVRRAEHLRELGLPRIVSIPYVRDYYEPFKRAMTLARLAAKATGNVARRLESEDEEVIPSRPLRASVRNALTSQVKLVGAAPMAAKMAGPRESAGGAAGELAADS